MSCKNVCRLCKNLILTQSISFAGNQVVLQIPENSFRNRDKVCIVTAQVIPSDSTINSLVFVQIGTGTQLYPLVKKNCKQMTAKDLRTRTKYSACVELDATSGIFKLLGCVCNQCGDTISSINGTAPEATPTAGA